MHICDPNKHKKRRGCNKIAAAPCSCLEPRWEANSPCCSTELFQNWTKNGFIFWLHKSDLGSFGILDRKKISNSNLEPNLCTLNNITVALPRFPRPLIRSVNTGDSFTKPLHCYEFSRFFRENLWILRCAVCVAKTWLPVSCPWCEQWPRARRKLRLDGCDARCLSRDGVVACIRRVVGCECRSWTSPRLPYFH